MLTNDYKVNHMPALGSWVLPGTLLDVWVTKHRICNGEAKAGTQLKKYCSLVILST